MTKETTVIETGIARTLTVRNFGESFNLRVLDTDAEKDIWTHLDPEHATPLANALLGDNATVVTDLPEVTFDQELYGTRKVVRAGSTAFYTNRDPAKMLTNAKELLAIHAALLKHNEEQEAAKKAEAEAAEAKVVARNKRREELNTELRGYGTYDGSTTKFQAAIDRIIDLEEAAKVS